MATDGSPTAGAEEDTRCADLARVLEGITVQEVWSFAHTSGSHDEKVSGLGRATQSVQPLVQSMAQQQGIGAGSVGVRVEANSRVGKHVVSKGLTKKANLKQWTRRL